jgi:hypothetical protein
MQHPFITDLNSKSMEDLQTTISNLSTKLNFAHRSLNGPMINQLQMALESYQIEYNKRIDEAYKKQNIGNKINISHENK